MNPINFGFIGAGKIAESSACSVNQHLHGRVIAVQDLNPHRRDTLANDFDIEKRFDTAEQLFDCPSVDAVYIAVPNKFHADLAIAAMEAGKHVLLEKPFAMNAREAQRVLTAARQYQRVFTLGMNQRYNPDSQKIKHLSEGGALGEIYFAKAYWYRRTGIPKLGTWFGSKELAGAGAINDIGVHLLDLCLHVLGDFDAAAVSGSVYTKFGNRDLGAGTWGKSDTINAPFDVDDLASAFIKMKSGTTVTLDVAWACHQESPNRMNVEVFGTEAGASLYPAKVFKPDPLSESHVVIENVAAPLALEHADRFHNFINHLIGDEPLLVKPEEALQVQRILDAVVESAAIGKEVNLT